MLLQATAGSAALLQDVRTVHHNSVSVRGVAVAGSPGGEGAACRPELAPAGWMRAESEPVPLAQRFLPLLHVDVCVSCEFSATSSHQGEMGGVGWVDRAAGPVGAAGACLVLRRGRLLAAAMMCGFP